MALTIVVALGVFVVAVIPRLWQLDYFLMVDENLWYQRSALFLQGLTSGQLAQTAQTGHPGVTTMWAGTVGLLLHYLQSSPPGESLAAFADRITGTPATLETLRLLRLPLALLSALIVTLAFWLGRRLIGFGPALAGAGLMAFEPLFLAHSRVLHHDSPAADFAVLAVLGWLLYRKEERGRYLLLAGLGIALAMLSKISSIFLLGFAGLTLLPLIWQQRRHLWQGIKAAALPWLKLAAVTVVVFVLAWPAMWGAPAQALGKLSYFIGHESGGHAAGTFFLGQPVPDAGPLYYLLGLAFALTPVTWLGLVLAVVSLALAFRKTRRENTPFMSGGRRWAVWLLIYAVLFVVYMSAIAKKQERYVLPAVVMLDLVAGWGWFTLVAMLVNHFVPSRAGFRSWQMIGLPVLLTLAQLAFVWPTAPYYSTFYNPLLGGGGQARKLLLVGRGEGLEQAVRYIQSQSDRDPERVASWYGTTVTVLFGDQVDVSDVAHPQYVLNSQYVIFYINQLQRQLPKTALMRYVEREAPVHTVQMSGIDYAYVYQGNSIQHPVDPYAAQNRLAGKANLAGFELEGSLAAGAQVPLRLYWVNDGVQSGEHFYVRLADELGQDWAWGPCFPDPDFGDAGSWQKEDIIESECQLTVYPGTPPGDYLLRAGIVGEGGTVIGQINLSPDEGTVSVERPPDYPDDEWVPVEYPVGSALNDDVFLIGYDFEPGARKPAESIPVTFYWRAASEVQEDYWLQLTLEGQGPGQYLELKGRPVNGRHPTPDWQEGEVVRDPWLLDLPSSLPGGDYALTLTLVDNQGEAAGQFDLPPVTVEGREHAFSLAQPPLVSQPARLGEAVELLGYDLAGAVEGQSLIAGQDLELTLTWRALSTPSGNYVVFVQLLDPANQLYGQHDGQPGDGALITSTWAPGEYVRDTHRISLPADLPPGEYRLITGMYLPESGDRLPAFDQDGQATGDHITLSLPLQAP